jgi:hypothetical protein
MVTASGEGDQNTEVKREFTQNGFVDEHIQMYLSVHMKGGPIYHLVQGVMVGE